MDAAGDTCVERVYLGGNHEARLHKQIARYLPELLSFTGPGDSEPLLSMTRILGLDRLSFLFVDNTRGFWPFGRYRVTEGLIATHGWLARKGAGNSARASIENANTSIIVGHTHRLAVTHVTRWRDGEPELFVAAEAGTSSAPEGLQYANTPDWQSGFLTVAVGDDGGFSVEVARFDGHGVLWRDGYWPG